MTSDKKLPSCIYLTRNTRDALNNNAVFTKKDLTFLFCDQGDKESDKLEMRLSSDIVTWLKLYGYLFQSSDCRWRKTEKLNELLAEGVEEIQTI
uniref:Uncharacterized protein n=1 Tax=viral metagenome TaxID=1070528 RepID=A0A6M3LYN2_9ZZZZ